LANLGIGGRKMANELMVRLGLMPSDQAEPSWLELESLEGLALDEEEDGEKDEEG
jgi:hypothetical protein